MITFVTMKTSCIQCAACSILDITGVYLHRKTNTRSPISPHLFYSRTIPFHQTPHLKSHSNCVKFSHNSSITLDTHFDSTPKLPIKNHHFKIVWQCKNHIYLTHLTSQNHQKSIILSNSAKLTTNLAHYPSLSITQSHILSIIHHIKYHITYVTKFKQNISKYQIKHTPLTITHKKFNSVNHFAMSKYQIIIIILFHLTSPLISSATITHKYNSTHTLPFITL